MRENKIKRKFIYVFSVFAVLVSVLFLAGCTRTVENNDTRIANPASDFCIDNGGTLDIRTYADGQVGYCTINGIECEEWALFRGECSKMHICTAQEKAAKACTLEYSPVCGSDAKSYGNRCGACASGIDYYVPGECDVKFDVAEVLNETCTQDNDCTTPASYLLRSSCPYTTKCIDGECAVVCPRFDGKEYPQVRDCGECPQYVAPGPDFCRNGTIVAGPIDECGCQRPPTCVPKI